MIGKTGTNGVAERPLHVGLGAAQDDHADVHQHEREQGADVDQLDDLRQRHERGQDRDQDAEADSVSRAGVP